MDTAKLTLTIGHNVGDTETHTTAAICEAVSKYLHIDAYTAIPCFGMWQGKPEASTRIEYVGPHFEIIRALNYVPALCEALKQECIMTEVLEEANVSFAVPINRPALRTA